MGDTTPPEAPSTPDLDPTSDTGRSDTDNVTNDSTPTFDGTAEAGSTVRIVVDGVEKGSGIAANGNYNITSSELSLGSHSVTVRAEDLAGNESAQSVALDIEIVEATACHSAPSGNGQLVTGSKVVNGTPFADKILGTAGVDTVAGATASRAKQATTASRVMRATMRSSAAAAPTASPRVRAGTSCSPKRATTTSTPMMAPATRSTAARATATGSRPTGVRSGGYCTGRLCLRVPRRGGCSAWWSWGRSGRGTAG